MGDAAEATAARKACPKCRTEQNIDQFYDVRGNGRIVVNCLSCRDNKRLHVISLLTISFTQADLSQVDASRASAHAFRAIARGEDHALPLAPALAPAPEPRRNLTHGVLATMYHERGRVATDTPEMAAARGHRLAIQRRHRSDRRHGEQPSQTPPLSDLLRRQQLRNAEDEAPTIGRGNLLPVQAPEEENLEDDADGLPPQLLRRGRPPKRRSPPSASPPRSFVRRQGRPQLARNPVASNAPPKTAPLANLTSPVRSLQATTKRRL